MASSSFQVQSVYPSLFLGGMVVVLFLALIRGGSTPQKKNRQSIGLTLIFGGMSELWSSEQQILKLESFQALTSTPFGGDINAMHWSRQLVGDFEEIVQKLGPTEGLLAIGLEDLNELKLSPQGALARQFLIEDLQLLTAHGASPTLNLIKSYERDDFFFPCDVYSFHVDRSSEPTDTFLCTYYGASSELLPSRSAVQKIHIPEIRAELKKLYAGPDEGFEAFLTEYFFDLHYQPKPNAQPVSLGVGDLWRLAVDHPHSAVLPCIHRAPKENPGQYRLLLIC